MLYALRSAKRPNKFCSAELHNNRKFTTVKDIITTKPNKNHIVSENDNNFQLELSDFPGEQDSEILVRERARGTKLDGLYKKKKGVITNETDHTITINKKRQLTTYSKRDVAIPNEAQASTSQPIARKLRYKRTPTNDKEQIKNAQPEKATKPTNPKEKKKRSKLPKEFHRLKNWEQLDNDSSDEEEERRRQKTAIKATTVWEKQAKQNQNQTKKPPASNQAIDRKERERLPTILGTQ